MKPIPSSSEKEKPAARITQQFRESRNMTYELDCVGVRLIIRIFPPNGVATEWKVEARANEGADAVVATATGTSPSSALEGVARWWRDNATAHALANYDWAAIAQAMAAVRAI